MKIKVGRYVWIYFYLGIIFSIFCIVLVIIEFHPIIHLLKENLILNTLCLIYILTPGLMWLFLCPRAFVIVRIQTNFISSSLFGKIKCNVDTNLEVWYSIIEANPEKMRGSGGTFIIISNKPFLHEQRKIVGNGLRKKVILFENHYDMTQMILIPYNHKTKLLLPLEKWSENI